MIKCMRNTELDQVFLSAIKYILKLVLNNTLLMYILIYYFIHMEFQINVKNYNI